jgi:hypothetical protein
LRTRVFGEVSDIAVDSPAVFGGQTAAGYDSLNLLVETVTLRALLTNRIVAVAAANITKR